MPRSKTPSAFKSVNLKMKILMGLAVFLFTYGIAGHMVLFRMDFVHALLATGSTLAVHYTTAPFALGEAFQVSLTLFGVVIFWWAIWTVFDMTAEGKMKEYFSEVRHMSDIDKLRNHYIICGAGRVGLHVAKLLALEKKQFVLIDEHEDDVEEAKKDGFLVIKGDPFEEETLIRAGLTKAHAIIAVMRETEKNILITIMAKEFNPTAKIYARTEKEDLMRTLKKLGADHVIMPEVVGAINIVNAITRDAKEHEHEKYGGPGQQGKSV